VRLARFSALILVLAAVSVALAPAAQAGWGPRFQLAAPGGLDTIPAQLDFSAAGAVAAAFGVTNLDNPAVSNAFVTVRSPGGAVGKPLHVPGAQQILSLTFDGSSIELLIGTSPAGLTCCSSAHVVQLTNRGRFTGARTLVSGLVGDSLGQLVTLAGGPVLAAVASGNGVWAAQSASGTRFAAAHRLTAAQALPESLSATSLGADKSIVAWTAASAPRALAGSIFIATGTKTSAPRRARVALTVPAGHRIDQLGLAATASIPAVTWIESWFDRQGAYHAEARVADLTGRPLVRTLSRANQVVSGLAFAADPVGDQAVAWKVCPTLRSCTLQAALRRRGASYAAPASLGPIDPSQTPALAVGPSGEALLGWVRLGHPVVAVSPAVAAASHRSARFGAPRVLSATTYAADLTLAAGPAQKAIAVWTQGTLAPSVVGDAYTG
jgi:hypothetical protein